MFRNHYEALIMVGDCWQFNGQHGHHRHWCWICGFLFQTPSITLINDMVSFRPHCTCHAWDISKFCDAKTYYPWPTEIAIWFIVVCIIQPNLGRYHRADSRFAPSQWETSLQSNAVSQWLGANLESALYPKSLTHWGQVTHICVGNLAIFWTIAGMLLMGPLEQTSIKLQSEFIHFQSRKSILSRPQCVKSLSGL